MVQVEVVVGHVSVYVLLQLFPRCRGQDVSAIGFPRFMSDEQPDSGGVPATGNTRTGDALASRQFLALLEHRLTRAGTIDWVLIQKVR